MRFSAWKSLTGQANAIDHEAEGEAVKKIAEPVPVLAAVDNYINRLSADGAYADQQAVLIQTLSGRVLADYNSDRPLNPASVMKLATSYLALKHFGPDYRFKTVIFTNGLIDPEQQTLLGDLIIESEGDPNFTFIDAHTMAAQLRSQGIRRVEGALRLQGPFRFRHRSSTEFAYARWKQILGLNFAKEPAAQPDVDKAERLVLATHESQTVRELLLYMNAHSDNFYADQLGAAMGGPSVLQTELMTEFHLNNDTLCINYCSGLDYNRITPRASIAILHKMINLLGTHQLRIEDIMPVAGVDSGTLLTRLRQPGVVGSVVAKTGTLNNTDRGVSTLQGVIYTEKYGPLLFAIFNMGGGVHYFRRQQDRFLMEAMAELETTLQAVRTDNILAPEQEQGAELVMARSRPRGRVHARRAVMRSRQARAAKQVRRGKPVTRSRTR